MTREYTDSGVDWLGAIPVGWRTSPLWTMFTRTKDVEHPEEQMLSVFRDYGVVTKDSRENINETAENRNIYQLVHPGWLVANRMKAWQGSVGISGLRGIVSGHYICFAPHHDADERFLNWLFRSSAYADGYALLSRGVRVGQAEIDNELYRKMPVLLPPRGEQGAIADYLDLETARIDALIADQKRLIELLRERRLAVATDILGSRIGAGERLKWLVTEVDQRAGVPATTLPLMSVSISSGVRRRDEVADGQTRTDDLANYKVCRGRDLVINRMRAFQGALGLAPEDGVVSPDYAVLAIDSSVDANWLVSVMKTADFVAEMAMRVKGIGSADLGNARTPRINVSDLGEIRVDVPGRETQVVEASSVRNQTIKIDTLIAEAERFIELGQERRSALITAVVTGQVELDEVA